MEYYQIFLQSTLHLYESYKFSDKFIMVSEATIFNQLKAKKSQTSIKTTMRGLKKNDVPIQLKR